MRKRLATSLAAFLVLLGLHVEAMVIHLAPSASVNGDGVRLGDVAVRGQALPPGWTERKVGNVPPSTTTWLITLSEVAQNLHRYTDMHDVVLRGNPEIKLSVRVTAFSLEQLDEAITKHLRDADPDSERRLQVCRRTVVLPQLPAGTSWTPEVQRLDVLDNGFIAHVAFSSESGSSLEEGLVEIPVEEIFPFWHVSRPLLRGATLRDEDLGTRWMPASDGRRYYPAETDITGMELRRNLHAGQMIALGSLAEPVFARRGEVIRVKFEYGGMTVTLRARALSDGRRDERIACLNESSGKRLYVRMISPREAVLEGETPS